MEKSDPSRQATRQSKTLEPVAEGEVDFANAYDLDDEESWVREITHKLQMQQMCPKVLETNKWLMSNETGSIIYISLAI